VYERDSVPKFSFLKEKKIINPMIYFTATAIQAARSHKLEEI